VRSAGPRPGLCADRLRQKTFGCGLPGPGADAWRTGRLPRLCHPGRRSGLPGVEAMNHWAAATGGAVDFLHFRLLIEPARPSQGSSMRTVVMTSSEKVVLYFPVMPVQAY